MPATSKTTKSSPKKAAIKKPTKKNAAKATGATKGTSKDLKVKSIAWYPNESYAEIYHSGVQFALAGAPDKNGVVAQCHGFAYCKDFLQDAIRNHLHDGTSSIWGFKFTNAKNPAPDTTNLSMLIRSSTMSNELSSKRLEATQECMRQAEKVLKIKGSTVVYDVTDASCKQTTLLVVSPKAWLKHPTMLSFYSLLLRIAFNDYVMGDTFLETIQKVKAGKTKGSNDRSYITRSEKGINRILKEGHISLFGKDSDIKKNYPAGMSIGKLHDYTGIVHFSEKL